MGHRWPICSNLDHQATEDFEDNFIIDSGRKENGWMFWSSSSGHNIGPYLFRDKDTVAITIEKYCEIMIVLVRGWTARYHLKILHDNALCHSARRTIKELQD